MNSNTDYEGIKDSVVYSFEEYVQDEGFTPSQATGKIFEEDWRELNYNAFSKASYYICVAIECFKLNEIPDFVYDELKIYIKYANFENEVDKQDVEKLLQDICECKKLMELNNYKIIESSYAAKSRIEYILSLNP